MNNFSRLCRDAGISVAFFVGSLHGQAFTSPSGRLTTEAPAEHGYVLGSVDGVRWQQVDSTQRAAGLRRDIRSIAWRRDAQLPPNPNYGARVFRQLSVVMAHGAIGSLSTDLQSNYLDTPVVVFTPKDVVVPDWSGAPASIPAPFDLALSFDVPWTYNGVDDLLWEVRFQSVSPAPSGLRNFPYDFQPDTGSLVSTQLGGQFLSQGCIAAGQSRSRFVLGVEFGNHGGEFQLAYSVNFGPRRGLVSTLLDFRDSNRNWPGLCTRLHASPNVTLALGMASAAGSVAASTERVPHTTSAIGLSLYLQAVALDSSQSGIPVALSQGVRIVIPQDPNAARVAHAYSYPSPTGAPFAVVDTGGIVARFGF